MKPTFGHTVVCVSKSVYSSGSSALLSWSSSEFRMHDFTLPEECASLLSFYLSITSSAPKIIEPVDRMRGEIKSTLRQVKIYDFGWTNEFCAQLVICTIRKKTSGLVL